MKFWWSISPKLHPQDDFINKVAIFEATSHFVIDTIEVSYHKSLRTPNPLNV